MALPGENEWILLAAALIAHSDHKLESEEMERLMALVDARLDADGYAEWMARLGDPDALSARLDEIEPPAADAHRRVLEEAWAMAMVDGDEHEAETAMLVQLAGKLGVEGVQLEFWKQAWVERDAVFSECVARAAAHVLGPAADVTGLIETLPVTRAQREELTVLASVSTSQADAAQRVRALERTHRAQVVLVLAPWLGADDAHTRLVELATAAGIPEPEAQVLIATTR